MVVLLGYNYYRKLQQHNASIAPLRPHQYVSSSCGHIGQLCPEAQDAFITSFEVVETESRMINSCKLSIPTEREIEGIEYLSHVPHIAILKGHRIFIRSYVPR